MNPQADANLAARAEFFKALGHPVRLMIISLVKVKPRHGEELALILGLNPATISHHLGLLTNAGLLISQKDQYYQTYSLVKNVLEKTLAEATDLPQPWSTPGVEVDAYRLKVIETFLRRGRLVSIPTQLKKRQVILEKIAQDFEPGRDYTEREVNLVLVEYHDDVATLRRGLVEHALMERKGGIYHRKD